MPQLHLLAEGQTTSLDTLTGGADCFLVSEPYIVASSDSLLTVAVADGVSNSSYAKDAANTVIQAVSRSHYARNTDLEKILHEANNQLTQMNKDNSASTPSETTLVVAQIIDRNLQITNIGDSRGYLYDPEKNFLEQLTIDHNLIQSITKSNSYKDQTEKHLYDEFNMHVGRDALTQVLGIKSIKDYPPTISRILSPGQLLLLCSDGLYSGLSNDLLAKLVLDFYELDDIADLLIQKARERGIIDDITVISVRFSSDMKGRINE